MSGTYSFVEVKLYHEELRRFLNTDSSDAKDLWKWLEKQKKLALVGAKAMVGVKTGALRQNISATHLGNSTGQYVTIMADKSYALMHHEGTKPHWITPHDGKMLRFTRGSAVVYRQRVYHPGTKANPYLRAQLIHFRG